MKNANISFYRSALRSSTVLVAAAAIAAPAFAQDQEQETAEETIVVTGSRIARPNQESVSPIAVATGEQVVANADITLETFLNTLPQVNPAGTTTSNNPSNNGQASIDLRGLGSNRNLVLISGRRPMVSATDQSVDVNTIPQGLIERIEVITGGAGAAYGADAIAGVVNIIMKEDFEGLDLRANYANTFDTDAREYQISGTIGGNFADGRGNVAFSVEYANRQSLIKSQRSFAAQATSTTGSFPTGRITNVSGNPIDQAAIDALFAGYGSDAKDIPTPGLLAFNSDGSLFGVGTFNSPRDVANFRYELDSPANPNLNYFPDFYSYNFDIVNLLVLPLERKSAFFKGKYEISSAVEFFTQASFTNYTSSTALAPTPVGVPIRAPGENGATQAFSNLIEPGGRFTGFVIPTTNPFISPDLRTLLNSRTGDDLRLVGSGADEAFNIGYRFLGTGLREQAFENEVLQGLVGLRGQIAEGWRYETYFSWGQTTIDQEARGNVNVQKAQQLLEAADGGASLCDGGFNPFGIQPLSQDCIDFVDEVGRTSTVFTQKIAQGYITGELAQLPAGALAVVLGAERRQFSYDFDPGALFGPIAGFNTSVPAGGSNTFTDYFGELNIPIAKGEAWADTLEITLQARHSTSKFNDTVNEVRGDSQSDWAYGGNITWAPIPELRLRGSYQRSVRAPNFGELFSGGGSFPQIFDPCSAGTNFRTSGGAAARTLCQDAGFAGGIGALVDSFAATPGAQAFLGFSGNTDLKPEKGETFTLGAVFNWRGLSGSIDYYNIKVKDRIFFPDPNIFIASCYNYNGLNPNLEADNIYCSTLFRTPDIAQLVIPEELGGDENGYFQAINLGKIKTSGIDFQLGYRLETDAVTENSALNLGLFLSYLIDYKVEEQPGKVYDYADTAPYFGTSLGQSFPRWKGVLNAAWTLDPFTISTRIRYIDGMKNRASVQFPGESFTGPGSVVYVDAAIEANIDPVVLRFGINNLFDKQPPQYAPNVQSGTDPSTYDVIGRRAYVSARLKF